MRTEEYSLWEFGVNFDPSEPLSFKLDPFTDILRTFSTSPDKVDEPASKQLVTVLVFRVEVGEGVRAAFVK